jgi:hypothetical protein
VVFRARVPEPDIFRNVHQTATVAKSRVLKVTKTAAVSAMCVGEAVSSV